MLTFNPTTISGKNTLVLLGPGQPTLTESGGKTYMPTSTAMWLKISCAIEGFDISAEAGTETAEMVCGPIDYAGEVTYKVADQRIRIGSGQDVSSLISNLEVDDSGMTTWTVVIVHGMTPTATSPLPGMSASVYTCQSPLPAPGTIDGSASTYASVMLAGVSVIDAHPFVVIGDAPAGS